MSRFVLLKPILSDHHVRRLKKHGALYLVQREKNGILEAKSIATGAIVPIDEDMVLEFGNALREQAPPV